MIPLELDSNLLTIADLASFFLRGSSEQPVGFELGHSTSSALTGSAHLKPSLEAALSAPAKSQYAWPVKQVG